MKLYTINATPMRTKAQWVKRDSDLKAKSQAFLDEVNEWHMTDYPRVVGLFFESIGESGFTIYPVQGYWKGKAEPSFKIELATDNEAGVREVCEQLKSYYDQDAVMLTLPNNEVEFI